MPEQTLLQRARQRIEMAKCLPAFQQASHVGIAIDCILRYLEERHEAARAPQEVPTASTLQRYKAPAPTEEQVKLQRELSGLAGQFKSFDLDLEFTRQDATAPATAAHDTLDLDALQALCDAATPGPWEFDEADCEVRGPSDEPPTICAFPDVGAFITARDAEFIAAARDALPKLIAKVRELQGERDELLAVASGLVDGTLVDAELDEAAVRVRARVRSVRNDL